MAARWTDVDDRLLAQLHARGLTDARIGAKLGRTEYAVSTRRSQLGLLTVPQRAPRRLSAQVAGGSLTALDAFIRKPIA